MRPTSGVGYVNVFEVYSAYVIPLPGHRAYVGNLTLPRHAQHKEDFVVAKKTITKLVDDIDGGEAHETVKFGLDGYVYEIDLSTKNANKLRSVLATYVEKGSRVPGRLTAGAGRAVRRGSAGAEREQNQAIRAWAQRKGIPVAPRGRIKQEIIEQYHQRAGR
jgi:hypothetical protein